MLGKKKKKKSVKFNFYEPSKSTNKLFESVHTHRFNITCWVSCCIWTSLFFSSRSSRDFLPSCDPCSSRVCREVFSSPLLRSCSLSASSSPLRALTSSWSSHCFCLPHLYGTQYVIRHSGQTVIKMDQKYPLLPIWSIISDAWGTDKMSFVQGYSVWHLNK